MVSITLIAMNMYGDVGNEITPDGSIADSSEEKEECKCLYHKSFN